MPIAFDFSDISVNFIVITFRSLDEWKDGSVVCNVSSKLIKGGISRGPERMFKEV